MAVEPGSRGRIIVFGILFWYPLAGVTYQFLHYLLALRRLGYDPYYIEDSGRWIYDPALERSVAGRRAPMWRPSRRCSRRTASPGGGRFAAHYPGRPLLRHERGSRSCGSIARPTRSSTSPARRRSARSICRCRRRIYVESDPFASQVKVANGDAATIAALDAHDTHFTFGENIGQPDCDCPGAALSLAADAPAGRQWICGSTRYIAAGAPFTTITTWHNTGKDVVVQRRPLLLDQGPRVRAASSICRSAARAFELAVGVDDDDAAAARRDMAGACGRSIDLSASVHRLSRLHPALARRVHGGAGSICAAAHRLVQRSHACYLAAGRPVITEDTGFGKFTPTGRGLFAFSNDGRRAGGGRRDRKRLRRALPRRTRDRRGIFRRRAGGRQPDGARRGCDGDARPSRSSPVTWSAIPSAATCCRSCTGWPGCGGSATT